MRARFPCYGSEPNKKPCKFPTMEDSEFCMFHGQCAKDWLILPSLKEVVEKHRSDKLNNLPMIHIPHCSYNCSRESIHESIEYLQDKYNYSFKFNHRNILVYQSKLKIKKQEKRQQNYEINKKQDSSVILSLLPFLYFIMILRLIEILNRSFY